MDVTILCDLADSAAPPYSPAPWLSHAAGDRIEVRDANGRLVADVASVADATLIVGGPDLVAAARALIRAIASGQGDIADELVELHDLCYTANGGTPSAGPDAGADR